MKLETIRQLKLKSEEAFNLVYNEYYKLLYVVIYNLVENKDWTNNLLQDTFISIFNKSSQYRGGSFKYWCITIARNIALDYLRKKNKEREYLSNIQKIDLEYIDVDKSSFIEELKLVLNTQEFRVIELRYIYSLKFKDIASILDVSLSTVTNISSRAIKKLRSVYEKNN